MLLFELILQKKRIILNIKQEKDYLTQKGGVQPIERKTYRVLFLTNCKELLFL